RTKRGASTLAISPDGRTIASSLSRIIRLWDTATGNEVRLLQGHGKDVTCLAFSPDSTTLASGSIDATIRLWKVATGEEVPRFAGHKYTVGSLACSHDGKLLATTGGDNTIRLWDLASGKELHVIDLPLGERQVPTYGGQFTLPCVAFSPRA